MTDVCIAATVAADGRTVVIWESYRRAAGRQPANLAGSSAAFVRAPRVCQLSGTQVNAEPLRSTRPSPGNGM
jgi:hypothetical protein